MSPEAIIKNLSSLGVAIEMSGEDIVLKGLPSVLTDELCQTVRECKAEIIHLLLQPSSMSHESESLPMDATPRHPDACPRCDGQNLVIDQAGAYCVDCRRRPDVESSMPCSPLDSPKPLSVRWGSKQGWLRLTNPVSGEVVEIEAKSASRWLFDRLKSE